MENTMTYVEAYNYVLENCELPDNVREKIENAKAVVMKKKNNKKVSANAEENVRFGQVVVEVLTGSEGMTVTEVLQANATFAGISNQRLSRIMNDLVADNVLRKDKVKGKTLFTVA